MVYTYEPGIYGKRLDGFGLASGYLFVHFSVVGRFRSVSLVTRRV